LELAVLAEQVQQAAARLEANQHLAACLRLVVKAPSPIFIIPEGSAVDRKGQLQQDLFGLAAMAAVAVPGTLAFTAVAAVVALVMAVLRFLREEHLFTQELAATVVDKR
jgi:hypothetical protein